MYLNVRYGRRMPPSRTHVVDPSLADYITAHSAQPDEVQRQLMAATEARTGGASVMQIGGDQGTFFEIFASAMGFLWLSTVPPTNALVAQIFGVRYMSMLGGFVFLSHQVGSFLGAWLGGRIYDATGHYDLVWGIAVALGVFAALANLPVRETEIVRAAPAVA